MANIVKAIFKPDNLLNSYVAEDLRVKFAPMGTVAGETFKYNDTVYQVTTQMKIFAKVFNVKWVDVLVFFLIYNLFFEMMGNNYFIFAGVCAVASIILSIVKNLLFTSICKKSIIEKK